MAIMERRQRRCGRREEGEVKKSGGEEEKGRE